MLVGIGVWSILLTPALIGGDIAQALTSTTEPRLSLDHLIRTTPFVGSATSVRDDEGSAYVAGDDALWLASDNDDALFEVDRTTGALRREVAQSAFVNAPRFGVGGAAGQARTEDLEALAYDANADVLYAFSGSAGATPTAFRLTRDANQQFQVDSWQPLPSEWTGAGWRLADGLTYVANGPTIRTYDFPANTFGAAFSIPGLGGIFGLDFDDVTGDLLAVNTSERLWRASMTTRTLREGWEGISLTGLGLRDSRAVEVIGEQVLVSDGDDSRASSDPMNHAVFVLDVTAAAPDTTDPTITMVTPPAGAVYARNRVVNADFSCTDEPGGSGIASCVGTVADGHAIDTTTLGQHSFGVTATDVAGNTRVLNRPYTVTAARPDGRIRRGSGTLVGNNIENTTGSGQTRSGSAGRGHSVTYYASIQNDAAFAERLRLHGQGSTAQFTIGYRNPAGTNITDQVTAGTYTTPNLVTGGTFQVRITVTVRNTAPPHAVVVRTLTSISTSDTTRRDTVEFVTSRA